MEKIPRKRTDQPDLSTNSVTTTPNMDESAVRYQGLRPVQTQPPPLSTREVAVSDQFSVAQLTLPLPDFLRERPFFGHLLQTVVGRSDDQKKEMVHLTSRILQSMGVSPSVARNVCGSVHEFESMCRHFCGEGATVLITEESGQADLIVLPNADTAFLHHLAKLLVNYGSPVVAARLLCAAMLAVRDTPERAADLLKSYCQLISNTKQLPAPPLSLEGLIKAVQVRVPERLLATEVHALKRHFESAAANESDLVKVKTFTAGAGAFAADAITRSGSGDSRQRREFQVAVEKDLKTGGVPKTVLPTVLPEANEAHEAAADAYEQIKDFLPTVGMKDGVYVYKKREAGAVDERGTLHPDSLMEYLQLAAKAPLFMLPGLFNALIGYGKDHPDTPFTPAAIRALWIEFLRANPTEIDAATTYWLATADVDVDAVDVDVTALIKGLPSWAELRTLFRLNESGDEDAVQRTHRISMQLSETSDKLLKLIESFGGPSRDTLGKATQHFRGLVAHMVHRASYSRVLAGGKSPTFGDIDAMIPQPEEVIFLSEADHRMLLEAAMLLPFEQFDTLARRLLDSQFADTQRKDLDVLFGALKLDTQNAPFGKILEYVREGLGGAAPSSDIALLLSSALVSRSMHRDLTDDECKQLAVLAVTLAVPRPGERLANCLTRFFKQVGEHPLRQGASTRSLDRRFARLDKGLALRVAPETLASMLPEEQHKAQIALGACFAGRELLHPNGTQIHGNDRDANCVEAPPLLTPPVHRIARGHYYLCLQLHFAGLIGPQFHAERSERAERYLASVYRDLYRYWPELDTAFGVASAPLSDPIASQFLLAAHEASSSWSGVSLPEGHPSPIGRERLQTWVTSTKVHNTLGSKPS